MTLEQALANRRACRSYRTDPVEPAVLERVLAAAGRGPTAGNTWALDLVVLDGAESVGAYWDVTLPAGPGRDTFPWPGLLRAPVLVLAVVDPSAYVERYGERDKAHTGLGEGEDAWPVPYWWVDAGAAVMAMLLAAADAGLGSLLFGVFGHEPAVRRLLGIPDDRRIVGAVALGHPDRSDRRSASGRRGRPEPAKFIHRDAW